VKLSISGDGRGGGGIQDSRPAGPGPKRRSVPVVSGKVFAMRQAVENYLNLGMPTSQSIHGIHKVFASPPAGERGFSCIGIIC
jgi:hypothetical protein